MTEIDATCKKIPMSCGKPTTHTFTTPSNMSAKVATKKNSAAAPVSASASINMGNNNNNNTSNNDPAIAPVLAEQDVHQLVTYQEEAMAALTSENFSEVSMYIDRIQAFTLDDTDQQKRKNIICEASNKTVRVVVNSKKDADAEQKQVDEVAALIVKKNAEVQAAMKTLSDLKGRQQQLQAAAATKKQKYQSDENHLNEMLIKLGTALEAAVEEQAEQVEDKMGENDSGSDSGSDSEADSS